MVYYRSYSTEGASVNVVMPGRFTISTLMPEVADALYGLCRELGCGQAWTRLSKDGATEEFYPEPIFPEHSIPYGIRTNVSTEAWLGEYQWSRLMRGARLERGKREGYVRFDASLDARMGISKGLELFESFDDRRKRFLCWAEEYELADGTTCFRLDTNAGILWVRGAEQQVLRKQMLLSGLTNEANKPKFKAYAVVQLAEYDFGYSVGGEPFHEQTPWDGMTSIGRKKRRWHVLKGRVTLRCSLRLDVAGRYNNRLKSRPRHVVQLPYQTVWERWAGDDEKLVIPLDD